MDLQLKGPGSELSKRLYNLLSASRVLANTGGSGGPIYLPGSAKIHAQSLADLQEVKILPILISKGFSVIHNSSPATVAALAFALHVISILAQ